MRLCVLRRSAATTFSTPSTSWRGQCPSHLRHMGAVRHLLRYLAGSTGFSIIYKQGGFKLTTFSSANWGTNPDSGKSTSSYIIMLSNGPISFKVGIQELTAHFTMEAELVAAALTMEAVFCSNLMLEVGFKEGFGNVPPYIDNTTALHLAGNRSCQPSREAHRAEVLLCAGISGGG